MQNQLIALTDWQRLVLHSLKDQTGLTMNELSRRMYDHCMRPHILNELVPSHSGQLQIARK